MFTLTNCDTDTGIAPVLNCIDVDIRIVWWSVGVKGSLQHQFLLNELHLMLCSDTRQRFERLCSLTLATWVSSWLDKESASSHLIDWISGFCYIFPVALHIFLQSLEQCALAYFQHKVCRQLPCPSPSTSKFRRTVTISAITNLDGEEHQDDTCERVIRNVAPRKIIFLLHHAKLSQLNFLSITYWELILILRKYYDRFRSVLFPFIRLFPILNLKFI